MLCGGDELGRTQRGNNNAYCQDSEISWYDWSDVDDEQLDWVRRLVALRHGHPVFRRRRWFQGRRIRGIEDMAWFRPDGVEMNDDDWESGYAKSVGVFVNGESIQATDQFGGRITDDTFMVLFNASELDLDWQIPNNGWSARWVVELDSADPLIGTAERTSRFVAADETLPVTSRSIVLLRRTNADSIDHHPTRRGSIGR
jgi:glycogen operon protein